MTTTDVVRPKRGRNSVGDMVRSLGLIVAIVAVSLIFVPGLLHPSKSQRFAAASYTDDVTGFRQLSGKTALTPASLPRGWAANAGALTGTKATAHLHIGWATPGAKYAALEESVQSAGAIVASVLGARASVATASVPINGATWQVRTSSRGEYSLSRTVRGITVVITGSATDAQLQQLAASLR